MKFWPCGFYFKRHIFIFLWKLSLDNLGSRVSQSTFLLNFRNDAKIELTLKIHNEANGWRCERGQSLFLKATSLSYATSFLEISLKLLIFLIIVSYEEFLCQYQLFTSIFIDFLDFLTFPCYKETNDVAYNRWCQQYFTFNILQIDYLTIL